MAFHREIEPIQPDRDERVERIGGLEERRELSRSWTVATGTLACPECDLPVMPAAGVGPGTPLACSWCEHVAMGREFLTVTSDPRPMRVDVVATLA
jgi:hypothetical protein